MNRKQLSTFAREAVKGVKTEEEFAALTRQLRESFYEAALNAELDEHLGHKRNGASSSGNTRNGSMPKTLISDDGPLEIHTPRDRQGDFSPQIIKKRQTRTPSMDSKILSFYAKGMSTREVVATLEEFYDTQVSPTLVSRVTNSVLEQVTEWQSRPLDAVYPIVYLDCIFLKIRQDNHVINKSVYLALGVNLEGHKELLGLWISENEGAKFWLGVMTELQNRGVKDILIACVDGLKGFPEAINAVYPQTQIQLCIVHMVRNSIKFVPWKDYRPVITDLKQIYQAATEDEALLARERFAERWDDKYPQISRSWEANWENLNTLFRYPPDIRKAIYTTNAIESVNSVIRKAVKKRKVFPNDDSAKKVVYLAIQDASKKWSMPIRNWKAALNRFMIEFDERLQNYM